MDSKVTRSSLSLAAEPTIAPSIALCRCERWPHLNLPPSPGLCKVTGTRAQGRDGFLSAKKNVMVISGLRMCTASKSKNEAQTSRGTCWLSRKEHSTAAPAHRGPTRPVPHTSSLYDIESLRFADRLKTSILIP